MRREVDEATRDLVRQLEKRSEEIEKLLDEKRVLSREDRRNIVSTLKNVRQELKSNIPYLQKLFAEQMDKTVTEAKGEFETYLQNKMNRTCHMMVLIMMSNLEELTESEHDYKERIMQVIQDKPKLKNRMVSYAKHKDEETFRAELERIQKKLAR